MNKLLVGTLLAFVCISSYADDLKVADDFKSGDLVSADTFNQIFDTIEKINRTVVDTDLIGVWSCDAMTTRNTSGWTSKSLFYVLENAQVNLTAASSASTSLESPYSISTSNPSPFKREGAGTPPFTGAFSATYTLHKNKLFTKYSGDESARIWDVNIVSPSRFELTFLETSATSFPASYASFITCDSAEAVPASPTAPTATNNKTGINLAWTDASSDEKGFKVYRKLSTESEAKVIATQTGSTYSDTDLTEGQTAYYQVVAYNDNGESAKSKAVSATLDSILPQLIAVTPSNGSALTDADADFTNGDAALINGISATRTGGGTITITLTFSEKISVICQYSDAMPTMCGGDSAAKFQGLNNTYSFLGSGTTGTIFSTTIPFTPNYGSNPDTFTISVDAERIQDSNGNIMGADFSSTFSL
ncbi:fibronectin type III domain-containing protein, partial [Pseudomonadales bacterium]|nr:fibronectin type III domain-containing protein [Pseudomonadales bacterium]